MDLVLLGSGNVATHLGKALKDAGHRITQVYSKTYTNAEALAESLDAAATDKPVEIHQGADCYVIAVTDDAIAEVAGQLPANLTGLVVHTSGSTDREVLHPYALHYGVLYPLQTFSKIKTVAFDEIPVAVEASDSDSLALLNQLATSISNKTFPCDSQQRLSLHVAAVFACNFSNHLYAIAAEILQENKLDFDLIRPLILETAEKAMVHLPKDVQTGPAVRGDEAIIAKHLELLKAQPDLAEIYDLLSKAIVSKNKPNL